MHILQDLSSTSVAYQQHTLYDCKVAENYYEACIFYRLLICSFHWPKLPVSLKPLSMRLSWGKRQLVKTICNSQAMTLVQVLPTLASMGALAVSCSCDCIVYMQNLQKISSVQATSWRTCCRRWASWCR